MSDLVQFKHTVAAHIKQNKIIDDVVETITKIPNFNQLRLDPEITAYVCNVIENLIDKKDKKEMNKANLATMILIKAYTLEENELELVVKQIKYIDNNGGIKKASTTKKISKSAWEWFKRKVL